MPDRTLALSLPRSGECGFIPHRKEGETDDPVCNNDDRRNFLATCAAAMPAQAASGDEAAIKALESQFATAFNAKDIDAIMKVYAPDESLLVFDVVPPRQYAGAKAYRKDWEGLLALFQGPPKFEITDLNVVAVGPLGYGHSIQRVSGTDTKGQPIDLTVRVTDVYRKLKGNWLIVHEHVSVPVDLDTGKPDLASKP